MGSAAGRARTFLWTADGWRRERLARLIHAFAEPLSPAVGNDIRLTA